MHCHLLCSPNSTGLQEKFKDVENWDPVDPFKGSTSSNAEEPLPSSEELCVCPLRRQCVWWWGGGGGGGLIDRQRAAGCWCLWCRQAVGDAGVKSSV